MIELSEAEKESVRAALKVRSKRRKEYDTSNGEYQQACKDYEGVCKDYEGLSKEELGKVMTVLVEKANNKVKAQKAYNRCKSELEKAYADLDAVVEQIGFTASEIPR